MADEPATAFTANPALDACNAFGRLAGATTSAQARRFLDHAAQWIPREPDHYRHTDLAHAQALVRSPAPMRSRSRLIVTMAWWSIDNFGAFAAVIASAVVVLLLPPVTVGMAGRGTPPQAPSPAAALNSVPPSPASQDRNEEYR